MRNLLCLALWSMLPQSGILIIMWIHIMLEKEQLYGVTAFLSTLEMPTLEQRH